MFDKELLNHIEDAAVQAAESQHAQSGNIADLWKRLGALGSQHDLPELIDQARRSHWSGAVPVSHETPDAVFQPPESEPIEITGIDGSQVYPDSNEPVLWGYARAQGVRMGKSMAVEEERFLEVDGILNKEGYVLPHVVDAVRTELEMRAAACAVKEWPDDLALLDGGLLPFTGVALQQNAVAASALLSYIESLVSCRNRLIAGLVSSPRSRLLISLIRLADGQPIAGGGQRGVRDVDLMRHGLKVGERSAVFMHGSPRNDAFHAQDAAIYLFFMRISNHEIVRIEVPHWVAVDPERVGRIHAAVLKDSQALNYPYLLARAHNSVVIKEDVAKALRQRALRTYLEKGGVPLSAAAKQTFKQS